MSHHPHGAALGSRGCNLRDKGPRHGRLGWKWPPALTSQSIKALSLGQGHLPPQCTDTQLHSSAALSAVLVCSQLNLSSAASPLTPPLHLLALPSAASPGPHASFPGSSPLPANQLPSHLSASPLFLLNMGQPFYLVSPQPFDKGSSFLAAGGEAKTPALVS